MEPSVIFGVASKLLGGFGQAKAIRAENARRIREYERIREMRKRSWFQQLSIYGAKVNKYNIDLNENDLAAQRGYSKAQSDLRRTEGQLVADNEAKFRELVSKKLGRRRGSGQTGRSVQRGETLDMASYGRFTGRQAYKISMAREKFKERTEGIRRRQVSARRGLFSQVAFNPVPSMEPSPPVLRGTGMTMMNAFVGAAGALVGGMQPDPGAPIGDDMSPFSTSFDINYDLASAGSGSFLGDFGGAGAFTPYDMSVDYLPTTYGFDGGLSF